MYARKQTVLTLVPLVIVLILIYLGFQKHFETLNGGPQKYLSRTPVDLHLLEQDDPRLVAEVRRRFLVAPPPPGTPYALNVPVNEEPSKGQTKFIKEIFKGKRDLFFVECGANDGEFASNTLFFERQWGWTGLLIEPDPVEIPRLLRKQRQAWIAPVCLSFDKTPSTVRFEHVVGGGGQVLDPKAPAKPNEHLLQCMPFYTLLLAMNRTRIDYFSLDVEGAMWPILRSIPFDLLDIRTMSMEYFFMKPKEDEALKFMEEKGYRLHTKMSIPHWAEDFIFVKKDFNLDD